MVVSDLNCSLSEAAIRLEFGSPAHCAASVGYSPASSPGSCGEHRPHHKPVGIQAFVPHPSVEALHERILDRLAGSMNSSRICRRSLYASMTQLRNSSRLSQTIAFRQSERLKLPRPTLPPLAHWPARCPSPGVPGCGLRRQ